ncbi:MAG: glycosyltransferase family 2 protein [Bdellovibrionales bacterium]|nr:glycosyltransferase family 2 protein [Bdellovibrionales bacterium]
MKLSLVVPVFNEAHHLREVIPFLYSVKLPLEHEWIFIDDKSKDNSLELLKELSKTYPMRILEQPTNQGKGAAVIRGFKEATGDIIMIQDADFEYHPRDIPPLLVPLMDGDADVVYGSRFKKSAQQVHRTYHYFVNRFLTLMSNIFSGIYLTDMETCYKVFRADLLKSMNLQSNRFGIEVELTAYLGMVRARIHELPISYNPRTRLQGKKINWKDGVAALRHLIYFNFMVSKEKAFSNLPAKYSK